MKDLDSNNLYKEKRTKEFDRESVRDSNPNRLFILQRACFSSSKFLQIVMFSALLQMF